MSEETAAEDVIATLRDLRDFLSRNGDPWASNVEKVLEVAAWNRDYELKRAVLGMYGGMGSLSDIFICRTNGHVVDDEATANAALERLRAELWDRAQKL